MNSRLALAVAAALCLTGTLTACSESAAPTEAAVPADANPLFVQSSLPYQYPAFDQIKDEHYAPAFERGMAEQLQEVQAIAGNTEAPSFDNTIVAMERSGQLLGRVSRVFFNLAGANINPAMQKVQAEMAPKLAAHLDAILLNDQLFARVKSLYDQRDSLGLDDESLRLLERYHTDFVRAGARLSAEQKELMKGYNAELASLQTKFTQNVLGEVNAKGVLVESREELDGLSENAIAAAAEAAKAAGHEGKFILALQNYSNQPALSSLKNRAVRQRLYEASINRGSTGGEFDNREIVSRIAKLRAQRAQLMGYRNHAEYVLEDATAQTTTAVNKLLNEMAPAAVANARKEAADMQAIIDAEGGGFELAGWDWSYYAEKVRTARYDFDADQLKPYFEMNNVLENGVFYAANQLYGLSFKERKDLPVYHPDVRVFEVYNEDGSFLALFMTDFYARPSKRGGAWASAYVPQSELFGTRPVIANHLNVPKPPEGQPTLLTFDEANTMFHEFGHALHGMFSNVKYPRFAGTAVPRDFVEYPSQVNEMWMTDPAILKNYAKHYQTGEPIPQALLDKVAAASKFNQGFATTEYLAASLLDQAFHQIGPDEVPTDVIAFEAEALNKAGVDFAPVASRYRTTYFSHTFAGGYSAGYYSYIWSEVLDAESVEWFKENGGLKRENGDHFRATLLSRGGSKDAMQLFRDFRGRDPQLQPLLERRGLTAAQASAQQ